MADDVPTTVQSNSAEQRERVGSSGTLAIAAHVGKYEILAVLGQGGFGITYRAKDTQLGREVAIKEYLPTSFAVREHDGTVLPRSTQVAEDFRWGRQRFLDEAKTLALLEEAPGIVNVYDFLEANGTAYMVMALVRGETLEARLRRDRTLTPAAIHQLLPSLLKGLERVHEAGFLHRDIKPANILIDRDGQPTLIDFGASRAALQGRTQTLTAVYTPGYAAFEQFTSAKQGPYTDIYALGATLYHCVTGNQPPSAIERAKRDKIVPATEVGKGRYPPRLLAGIDAALEVDEADRPQTVTAWRRQLPDSPGAVSAPVRRRWPLRLAAAALALCLAGGGYVWWQGHQEDQAWARAASANTDAAYREYLTAYPAGRYVDEARRAISDLATQRDAAWRAEEDAWAQAKVANTVPAYRAYLASYPNGRFAADANKALADFEADEKAWALAAATHTEAAYRDYLKAWPTGLRAAEARKAVADLEHRRQEEERLKEDQVWATAKAANTVSVLQTYIDRYPAGRYVAEARGLLAELWKAEQVAKQRAEDDAWNAAKTANTILALRSYLDRYPAGRYAAEARIQIADIERTQQDASAQRTEDEAWATAQASNTHASLREYLDRYPTGRYAAPARERVAKLEREDDEAWATAKMENTPRSVRGYLDKYPKGRHVTEAGRILSGLLAVAVERIAREREEDEAWTAAKAANTHASLGTYLERFPSGRYVEEARRAIAGLQSDDQAWERAAGAHTIQAYRAYLLGHPKGRHAALANEAISDLETQLIPNQPRGAGVQPVIAKAYVSQARGWSRDFELDWTAVVSTWALQLYTHKPTGNGGLALLKYSRVQGWRVVADGGGVLSVADLVKLGVPQYIAGQLLGTAATTQSAPPAPASSATDDRAPGKEYRDCPQCPEMVRIPMGSFTMGAVPSEHAREGLPGDRGKTELPQHRVTISYAFSLGKYEVTRGEFAAFVLATGHQAGGDWRNPGFPQTDRDPVVNVSWDDAKAYVAWLSRTTGKTYRLPSESEWEYAARAGRVTVRYWGDGHREACRYANIDENMHGCRDGYEKTAPVGKFQPNQFGLYDMLGNVWEWTEDCWNESYAGAPADGSSWQQGECSVRVLRGGSWSDAPRGVRAAARMVRRSSGVHGHDLGFRVVRTEQEQQGAARQREDEVVGRLTQAELAAIADKVRPCWVLPQGVRIAVADPVSILIEMDPAGYVTRALISDGTQAVMASNPTLRAFAEAARRAVLNPRCRPLPYPRHKYEQLKRFEMKFDSRDFR